MGGREYLQTEMRSSIETALLINVSLVLIFLGFAFPFASPIVQIVAPVPLAIGTARNGARLPIIGAIVTWLVSSSLFGVVTGIWSMFYALAGVILGVAFRRGGGFLGIVCKVSVAYTFLSALTLVLAASVIGVGPIQLLNGTERAFVALIQFVQTYSPLGSNCSLSFAQQHPLAVLAFGLVLTCSIYSFLSCNIVRRILLRVA